MRRTEREKGREFGEKVIDQCNHMVLSMVDTAGLPYCVPLSPVRAGEMVYFHCAMDGDKVNLLCANPHVCAVFVGNTEIPAGKFTTYYDSAIAFGTASEVTDAAEKVEALRLLCLKYCPTDMAMFEAAVQGSLPRTAIWKISPDTVTCKSNFPI